MNIKLEEVSEEVEEILSPPKKTLLKKVLERVESIIQVYPVHIVGLTFAIGILIGVAISNSQKD
ncbi:MAG: hypothetical protein QXL69_06930 [Candidatus Bathyarchaeia archaeon]|nr:hypothetical protein [Candidatus Bathyarchaeota archaeon]